VNKDGSRSVFVGEGTGSERERLAVKEKNLSDGTMKFQIRKLPVGLKGFGLAVAVSFFLMTPHR